MRRTAIGLLLALPFPILAAEPILGPERRLAEYRAAERPSYKSTAAAAGSADGFFAVWCESSDRLRALGAYLTPDGKLARGPMVLGEPATTTLDVRADGPRYIVTSRSQPPQAWQVSPAGVAGIPPDPPPPVVENAAGEHLVIRGEDDSLAIYFYDRNGLQQGATVRTKLGSDGKPEQPLVLNAATGLRDVSLFHSRRGVTASYARADENTAATLHTDLSTAVILSREDGERSQNTQLEILRYAQDDV